MLQVMDAKDKKLICSDRRCGYEESADKDNVFQTGKISKKERMMSKRLIDQYSDKGRLGTNLGAALKAALEKKKEQ